MWMSDETQRKAIQSDTFSHIVYCWKANWGSCIVFYVPNFVSFAFLGCFFFYCDVSFEAVLRYPLRMCLAGGKQSIPCVPDTLHLHNTDRKNIHWIQMYNTSTISLPWTLSKVQALIRTAFQIYTNRNSRDWNISFCLPIGLEWFIRYEEIVG